MKTTDPMKAMILPQIVSLHDTSSPLQLVDLPKPTPDRNDVLIRIAACGVCHTELDEIEGRTPPARLPIVPGHQVVGEIEAVGTGVTGRVVGQRVGVGWIFQSSGGTNENVSPQFRATGRDANGGYAEYMTAPARYTYLIPDVFSSSEAAPLLCAGAIGYRAVRLANIGNGDLLGLTGFGGSAHLVLQLVQHIYPQTRVFVFARDERSRDFAVQLGAAWVGSTESRSPELLHAIIDTTPAWKPIVQAMKNLRPGGRLVINAIRKEDNDKASLLDLNYHEDLWMEKEIKSVANITRSDIEEFLPVAAEIPIKPRVQTYRLEDANRAILELKQGSIQGAKVLTMT